MRTRSLVLLALALLALVCLEACAVLGPTQDALLPSTSSELAFQGLYTAPDQEVQLQARDARGAFTTFGTTRTSRSAMTLPDGTRVYPWSARGVVSSWIKGECGREALVRAVVRVRGVDVPLMTFTEAGAACVQRHVDEGLSWADARTACGGAGSAEPIRIEADPVRHAGDLALGTQSEADAYRCLTHVDGALTIEGRDLVVSLPRLREVSGDLAVTLTAIESSSGAQFGRVDLPLLRRVGRDLRLTAARWPRSSSSSPTADFGLPSLTELEGGIDISLLQFNTIAAGVPSLYEVPGDVRLFTAAGELFAGALLPELDHVGGDLTIVGDHNAGNMLRALRRVEGDVLLAEHVHLASSTIPLLEHVGGTLTLREAGFARLFDRLAHVGGGLSLEGTGIGGVGTSRLGSAALSVGALSVTATRHPDVPLESAARVRSGGAILFVDNLALCASEADAFIARQRAIGWSGSSSVTGNDDC